MMCQACEDGDHANCGMQTWCSCDCDGEAIDLPELIDEERQAMNSLPEDFIERIIRGERPIQRKPGD